MLLQRKRLYSGACAVVILMVFANFLRFVFHPMTSNALLGISMMTLRWVIHITLTTLWCLSLRKRILSRSIRRLLLCVGALLLFWQVVRIIKYDYVIITEPIGRYCWYGFYIPMVLVPTLGIFIIDHIDKPEGYHSPKWMRLLFIPAFLLIAVVFTNDLHQLVFTFPEGFALYNSRYGYGFMYLIVMGWFIVTGLYFVIMLLFKSHVPGSKRFQKLPLLIMLGAILFWAGYSLRLYECDLTAMDCVIIALLLESAIQSGLIPSNMHYNELFRRSTIAAQIVAAGGEVKYSSAASTPLDGSILAQAMNGPVHLGDTLLHSQRISGGCVLWQDDVSTINQLASDLKENNDLLAQRNDLLQAEVAIRERRVQAEEKTRLYDRIAREIAPRLDKADALLRLCREDPEKSQTHLSRICVISAYIKRRANLILLGEEKPLTDARELESCLRESLDNLRLCGVMTALDCRCGGQASLDDIVAVYDLFEDVTEALLEELTAMILCTECKDGRISLRIQAGCRQAAAPLDSLTLPGGTAAITQTQDGVIIEAAMNQGGVS